MNKPVRRDQFLVPETTALPTGYYRLSKSKQLNQESNKILSEIRFVETVQDSDSDTITIANAEILEHFTEGDIAFVNSKGSLRITLSRLANHNTVLVTEQCDNLCLFCSQPPKDRDDFWLYKQAALAITEFNYKGQIGITGGEPLLNEKALLNLLDVVSETAPATSLHILSNGRKLSDLEFTRRLAIRTKKTEVTLGVPFYSCLPKVHNRLVGSQTAFEETTAGLINAGNSGIPLEIRVIPTQHNVKELPETVEYICRVFSNIVQISIMNLEPTGWAKKNWSALYLKPSDYTEELKAATAVAIRARVPIRLFNYPLCHLPQELRSLSVQSISDWKNYYPEECQDCSKIDICAGYFTSSKGIFHQEPRRL